VADQAALAAQALASLFPALDKNPMLSGWTMVKPVGFGELVGPLWRYVDY
jgi:hypothetical protein